MIDIKNVITCHGASPAPTVRPPIILALNVVDMVDAGLGINAVGFVILERGEAVLTAG